MLKEIFNSRIERAFFAWYRQIFSIHEIENEKILQWILGATIFSYFVTFSDWFYSSELTVDAFHRGSHSCWPYFQQCGEYLFLRALPDGYSQSFLYMVLFGLLVGAVYSAYKKEWVFAHLALIPAFLWHILGTFVLSMSLSGNYDYYLATFAIVVLFLPHKEFFLKCSLVLFYFLSTVAKIHPAWIQGAYFSALKTGLPIFPFWSIPLFTNLVIFMEMVAVWFLFSRNTLLQRGVLSFFILFHLYSGILVGYHYPAVVLPTLVILFGPLYRHTRIPFDARSIAGWVFIVALFCVQFVPRFIPGDEKLTMEGNRLGLYMFEANHQCISTARILKEGSRIEWRRTESYSARARCDPYKQWFKHKILCERDHSILSIAWTFDHSINGGPFLRIVDVPDACELAYKPFVHNEWIKTEVDSPTVIGYPVQNLYD